METILPFDLHVKEYEKWFNDYPFVFKSEVEALREMLPQGQNIKGIEVGMGTGRFSQALGISEGVELSARMRAVAERRGIVAQAGVAERLPYAEQKFDFVLMAFCICYFNDLHVAFMEAHRVLKRRGVFVVGFLDKNSLIGKQYESRKTESTFYKSAIFYTVDKVLFELSRAGFGQFKFHQTLFHALDEITDTEPSKPGYGEGSFVVIQATKG